MASSLKTLLKISISLACEIKILIYIDNRHYVTNPNASGSQMMHICITREPLRNWPLTVQPDGTKLSVALFGWYSVKLDEENCMKCSLIKFLRKMGKACSVTAVSRFISDIKSLVIRKSLPLKSIVYGSFWKVVWYAWEIQVNYWLVKFRPVKMMNIKITPGYSGVDPGKIRGLFN